MGLQLREAEACLARGTTHILCIVQGEKLLCLSQQLQELGLRESGFELAIAGTLSTLVMATSPTAVFLLLSYCNGQLFRSGESVIHFPSTACLPLADEGQQSSW